MSGGNCSSRAKQLLSIAMDDVGVIVGEGAVEVLTVTGMAVSVEMGMILVCWSGDFMIGVQPEITAKNACNTRIRAPFCQFEDLIRRIRLEKNEAFDEPNSGCFILGRRMS
jgi:hypothetical protein